MLKIKIDGEIAKIKTGDYKELAMAEMMFAVHAFYVNLKEDEKRWFKKSFKECIDDIFSEDELTDEDINKACDKADSIEKIGELLGALEDAIKELHK